MFTQLATYVAGIDRPIKNDDVQTTLGNVMDGIHEHVLPTLTAMIEASELPAVSESVILKTMIRGSNIDARTNRDYFAGLHEMFTSICKEEKALQAIVKKSLSEVLLAKTSTAKDASVAKIISDLYSMTMFVMDLNYMILITREESDLPKAKFVEVEQGVSSFTSAANLYGTDFDKLVKSLSKVSESVVLVDKEPALMDRLFANTGALIRLPNTPGFINNPIYHIRMWSADKDIDKYELLKEKKKLISLKLTDLKVRQQNEHNAGLAKQIAYYENKLSSVEYDIRDIIED